MTNYGFGDDEELPPLPKKKPKVKPSELTKAVEEGAELGFVPRPTSPKPAVAQTTRRRKKNEPQGRILVTGPERVLERLRDKADEQGVAYWVVIEQLLDAE